MNHKRRKPKSSRSGCLLCKPHKHQREGRVKRQKHRYQRARVAAEQQLADLA